MTSTGRDSFVVLRGLFERVPEPTLEQLRQEGAEPAVFDVYERLMRVRVVAPTVILSDKIYRLMDLVGLKGHRRTPQEGTTP